MKQIFESYLNKSLKRPIEIYIFLFFLFLFFTIDLLALVSPAQPLVHGHRGARSVLPENTLAAFQYAIDNNVDVLELDLAVTADNVLVVSHDPHINADICLDPKGSKIQKAPLIHSLNLSEVQKYDCGTLKNKKFPKQKSVKKEKIPTLQQVFDLVANSKNPHAQKIEFNIETKLFPNEPEATPTPEEFAKLVYELVEKNNLTSRVIVQSFDYRSLRAIKKINPNIRTSQLISDNLIDLAALAKASSVDIISPYWEWITKEEVEKLHEIGVKVAPWTANDPIAWKKLIDMKVDAIITDDPVSLQSYLKNQN